MVEIIDVKEKFEGRKKLRELGPTVWISPDGWIRFSSGAAEEFGVECFSNVVLFFDHEVRKMKMSFVNGVEPGAIEIFKEGGAFGILAPGFFEYFGIFVNENQLFFPVSEGRPSEVVLDLSNSGWC